MGAWVGRSVLQWDRTTARPRTREVRPARPRHATMLHPPSTSCAQGVEIDLATIPGREPEVCDLCARPTPSRVLGEPGPDGDASAATTGISTTSWSRCAVRRPIRGSVHPYPRRRNGEAKSHIHPSVDEAVAPRRRSACRCSGAAHAARYRLRRFTAAEADQLRQAMGSKRSQADGADTARLLAGMANAASPVTLRSRSTRSWRLLSLVSKAFGEFRPSRLFEPWIKYHYPAEFAAAL